MSANEPEQPSHPPAGRRPRRKRWWLGLFAFVSLVLSILILEAHVTARELVRTILVVQLGKTLQGRLDVQHIDELWLGGATVAGVTVHDPQGRLVLSARHVRVNYDLWGLLSNETRLTRLAIRDADLRLFPGKDSPLSLFDAFLPKPSAGGGSDAKSSHVIRIHGLTLERAQAKGDVEGLSGIVLDRLVLAGRLDIAEHFSAQVERLSASMTAPFVRPIAIEQVTTRFATGPALALEVHGRAALADDHVRARLRLNEAPGQELGYELVLGLEPISAQTLTELGIEQADTLISDVRGYVVLTGAAQATRVRATIETAAGRLAIHGERRDDGHEALSIATAQLELAQLLAFAPELGLQGSLNLDSTPGQPVEVTAELPALSGFGLTLEHFVLHGRYADERITLYDTSFAYAGGTFQTDGYVQDTGDFDLRVRSSLNNTLREPHLRAGGLKSRLATDLRLRNLNDELSAEGRVSFTALSLGDVSADTLVFEGSARGDPYAPQVTIQGQGTGLRVYGQALGKLRTVIRGADGVYTARTSLADEAGRRAEATLEVHDESAGPRIVARSMTLSVPGRDAWRGHGQVTFEPHDIVLKDIVLESAPQRLELSGRFSDSRAYRVAATLREFDVGGLRELSGVNFADLDGVASGEFVLSGVPGQPRVDARGTLTRGQFLGLTGLGLVVDAVFTEGRFDLNGELTLPDDSRMAITAGGKTGRGPTWLAEIEAGTYQLAVDFQHVPLAVSRPWLEWLNIEPPGGNISALLSGTRTPAGLTLELSTRVEALRIGELPALNIDTKLRHDGAQLAVDRLEISDEKGSIVTLNGQLTTTLPELLDPVALRSELETRPFELTAHIEQRRLDGFPFDQPYPLLASATLEGHQTASGPRFAFEAKASARAKELGADCAAGRTIALAFRAQNDGNDVRAELEAQAEGTPLLTARAQGELPVGPLAAGLDPFRMPEPSWSLDFDTEAAEEIPLLCTYGAGPVHMSAAGTGLPPAVRSLSLSMRSAALQLRPFSSGRSLHQLRAVRLLGRPFAVDAIGNLDADRLVFDAKLSGSLLGELHASGNLPAHLLGAPKGASENIEIDLDCDRFELAEVLAALPTGVRAAGRLQGAARIVIDLPDDRFSLSGLLDLDHGRLAIPALGQELSDASGRLLLGGDRIRLKDFEARDFDGRVTAQGELRLPSLTHATIDIDLRTRDFPVRREGAQISKLTGSLGFEADVTPERARAQLTLTDLRIDLPSDLAKGLQSLDDHPNISIVGAPPRAPPAHPYLYEVRVVSRRPFRVQRPDLSAEVSADLLVRYAEPLLSIEGSAELERGSFELYGKRFELGESRMAFDGKGGLDPLVSLSATHRIGSDDIGVRVDGRLSDPKVTFSHSNPRITNTGEIIAQLVGGRSSTSSSSSSQQNDAAGAAGTFLAGATAGLLTEEVRHEFGSNVPVVSVEGGDPSMRGARVRAGVQLDALIEKRLGPLSRVVRGAYIEGFVSPTTSSTTATQAAAPQGRGGGLLELRLPADLFGSVEYRPIQNWRLDIAWEP